MAGTTLGLLFLTIVFVATVRGDCPSNADGCIPRDDFAKLNKGDPGSYCEGGAVLAAKAQNCLRDCQFSEQNDFLTQKIKEINTYCAGVNSGCPAVASTYINQTRCYDSYGGLAAVIQDIINQFENGAENINCQKFLDGRYCQRVQNCDYNADLYSQIIKDNKIIVLGLAICGSEQLAQILQPLEETGGCGTALNAAIESKCNISCSMVDAKDSNGVCNLLQTQLQCFEDTIVNCTAAKRKYVLPRLNTYAVSNRHLGCKLKYNGILIRARGKAVDYSSLLDNCWFSNLQLAGGVNYDTIAGFYNRDYLIQDFCKTKANNTDSARIVACRTGFLQYPTPQSKLLLRPQDGELDLKTDFVSSLGGFPFDSYGMVEKYNQLPASCPNSLLWFTRLCVPTTDPPVIPTSTTPKSSSRSTPVPNTPPPGEGGVPTKRGDGDSQNFEHNSTDTTITIFSTKRGDGNLEHNSAGSVMPAAILIVTLAIYNLMY